MLCDDCVRQRNGECLGQIYTVCPECGKRADTLYKTKDGFIVGCDNCLIPLNSIEEEEYLECEQHKTAGGY